MPLAVRYAPGPSLLVATGTRWLLTEVSSATGVGDLAAELWRVLTGPGPAVEPVLALLEARYDAVPALVLVERPAHERGPDVVTTRGSGSLTAAAGSVGRGRWRLGVTHEALTDPATTGPTRADPGLLVLERGMTLASYALLPTAPATVPGLIDGIPPEILGATADSPPTPPPTPRPVATVESHTVRRDPRAVDPPPPTDPASPPPTIPAFPPPTIPLGSHLHQSTRETVLAVRCPTGHLTAAYVPQCRVCGTDVAPQEPHRVPRPALGVLRLADGSTITLDRGVLIGRQPSNPPGAAAPSDGEAWPHLVRLPPEVTFISRTHLRVELDGWLVLLVDLGSRGGTTLRVPGRAPERVRAGERYVWEPGAVVDLADAYEILLEVPDSGDGP